MTRPLRVNRVVARGRADGRPLVQVARAVARRPHAECPLERATASLARIWDVFVDLNAGGVLAARGPADFGDSDAIVLAGRVGPVVFSRGHSQP